MAKILALFIPLSVALFLWNTRFVYPLQLLTVFFHESSHALATILTGGEVKEMVVTAMVGGHVISMGGNRFICLSSGYLGSLLWGAVIYYLASSTKKDREVMLVLGIAVLSITLLYMSPFKSPFGYGFAIVTGLFLCFSSKKLSNALNDFLLRLIGLTSMIYVPHDILSDTIVRSHLRSDARMLAEEIGGTTHFWGGLWILLSFVIIAYTLYRGVQDDAG